MCAKLWLRQSNTFSHDKHTPIRVASKTMSCNTPLRAPCSGSGALNTPPRPWKKARKGDPPAHGIDPPLLCDFLLRKLHWRATTNLFFPLPPRVRECAHECAPCHKPATVALPSIFVPGTCKAVESLCQTYTIHRCVASPPPPLCSFVLVHV